MTSFWVADTHSCDHKILMQCAAAALDVFSQSILAVWECVPQTTCHQLSETQKCMLITHMIEALF